MSQEAGRLSSVRALSSPSGARGGWARAGLGSYLQLGTVLSIQVADWDMGPQLSAACPNKVLTLTGSDPEEATGNCFGGTAPELVEAGCAGSIGGPGAKHARSPAPAEGLHGEELERLSEAQASSLPGPRMNCFLPILAWTPTDPGACPRTTGSSISQQTERTFLNNSDTQELLEPKEGGGPSCPPSCHPSHWLRPSSRGLLLPPAGVRTAFSGMCGRTGRGWPGGLWTALPCPGVLRSTPAGPCSPAGCRSMHISCPLALIRQGSARLLG